MSISNFTKSWHESYLKVKEKLVENLQGRSLKQATISIFSDLKNEVSSINHKVKDLRKTNYDLGMYHYNAGNLSDALFRFKLLKKFYQGIDELDFFIGRCYIERNMGNKAKPYIEAYLKSTDTRFREEAKYCYDLIHGRLKNIQKIPLKILERTFDILAPKYNDIFLSKPNPPQDEVYKAISAYMSEIGSPYGNRILDLGCGTGYIVELLKRHKIAGSAQGVDISSKMLDICKNLKVDGIPCYDTLNNEDLEIFLNKEPSSQFDVIIASKTLHYFNDPKKLFDSCHKLLKPKGALVIAFKTSNDEELIQFDAFFEEFQFSHAYLSKQAKFHKLTVKNSVDVRFPDGDQGKIMLLIKG
jgi:predicted TPR repeat methyltransferase